MKQFVIVVAGGKGLRMGSTIPKQFLEIKGKAILLHTLEKFKKALPQAELFLVLPKSEFSRWNEISVGTDFETIKVAEGGEHRFASVKAGLSLIQESGIIGVHDSVRPLVAEETIRDTFAAAEKHGAAIPVVELKDSIRKIDEESSEAVNRKDYVLVQTPQCFHSEIIAKAYQQEYSENFTDDASVVEQNGGRIQLVKGNYSNIKITTVEDLKMAEFLLNS